MSLNAQFDLPKILLVDDKDMPQKLANQLFLRVKSAQLTSVENITRACDAIGMIGCDFIIVNQSCQLDQINGFLNRNPTSISLQGIIWITSQEEVTFNPEILRKVRVYLMDAETDAITDKIELVANGREGTSH